MDQQNAIILRDQVGRYNLMVDFVKTIMQSDRDYGIVPGTSKPTLLKPGAEKLNSLFNLYPKFTATEKVVDWANGLFFYQYECSLVHRQTGEIWGTGLGSCNSKESKYRYRWIPSDKKPTKDEAAELKARGLGKWRKDGDKWVWMERVENDQIYDIVNTIDKMAQKRALIAATLIACNASEFFTQDVEDIPGFSGEVVEGNFSEAPPEQKKAPPPPPDEPPAQDDKPEHNRPYSPDVLKEKLSALAIKFADKPVSDKQVGLAAMLIEKCFSGDGADAKRKAVQHYLFERESLKDAPAGWVLAMLEWLKPVKDSGGDYNPDQMAAKEAQAVYTEAMRQGGQQSELFEA